MSTKKKDENISQTTVYLDKQVYKDIKKHCIDVERNLSDVVNDLIKEFLKKLK